MARIYIPSADVQANLDAGWTIVNQPDVVGGDVHVLMDDSAVPPPSVGAPLPVSNFQNMVDLVTGNDPLVKLAGVIDPTYGFFEYSLNGLIITGGSDVALNIGAAALLRRMGFSFDTPHPANPNINTQLNNTIYFTFIIF